MEVLLKAGRGRDHHTPLPSSERRYPLPKSEVHMLRQRMREASHPDYKLAAKARLSLRWKDGDGPNDPATLTIKPFDAEFRDILQSAGVSAPALSLPTP